MERKSNVKLGTLKAIEEQIQAKWEEEKIAEVDADLTLEEGKKHKFFACFPYPYMNGVLHLGHTFSFSKAEFAIRYKKLKGYHSLFPFGFHCTGMPIKACSDKLKREMQEYSIDDLEGMDLKESPEEETKDDEEVIEIGKDKAKGKKSKAVSKTSHSLSQYQIMRSVGISKEEIPKFTDPKHWVEYFTPLAVKDLKKMGVFVDWRRSFVTTDINPYYDSFVRWQFNILNKRKYIWFGKRYCIFSPKDDQPCMDHDRANGEGVGPQEYTLIKMKLESPFPEALQSFPQGKVFLVAATLRPETMYGQTNCWVHPNIMYIAVRSVSDDIFVCTRRAARNMFYQELLKTKEGEYLAEIKGSDLICCMVSSNLSYYKSFYVLPLNTIKENKGTGVVTSVPAEAPDDYIAWKDLINDSKARDKYGIQLSYVENFKPIPVCCSDELGDQGAVKVCEELKIKNSNDKEKLRQAKEKVYLLGYYEAKMIHGPHAGEKVQSVKKKIQDETIKEGSGIRYMEPEKEVKSRSGDECVVALCDQWFLDYGSKEWKAATHKALDKINVFHDEVRKNFEATLDWFQAHACSRKYGLGTRLPWDKDWLIESLSDSTIYMAFYTVKHLIQGPGLFQHDNGLIKPEMLTDDVWDYIFFQDAPFPAGTEIPQETLKAIRAEFQYWYPVDLRVSGKDLVQNHLTYYIYTHVAMWEKDPAKWPVAIRANGHLLLNSDKMAKSTGNFMTVSQAVEKFGADGTRFALADSGDSIEDANFVASLAEAAILRLYSFLEWTKKALQEIDSYRSENNIRPFHDEFFENSMKKMVKLTDAFYDEMLFKEALRTGFFELQAARDKYRDLLGSEQMMRRDLVKKFIEFQIFIIAPICPHICDHMWRTDLKKENSIFCSIWPVVDDPDETKIEPAEYLIEALHNFRVKLKNHTVGQMKKKVSANLEPPNAATIWVADAYPKWQSIILDQLASEYDKGVVPDNKVLAAAFGKNPDLKKYQKKTMPFAQMIKDRVKEIGKQALAKTTPFDEFHVLTENTDYLKSSFSLQEVTIRSVKESQEEKLKEEICPGQPFIIFSS